MGWHKSTEPLEVEKSFITFKIIQTLVKWMGYPKVSQIDS